MRKNSICCMVMTRRSFSLLLVLMGALFFHNLEAKSRAELSGHHVQASIGLDRSHFITNLNYEYSMTKAVGLGGSLYFTPNDDEDFYSEILGLAFALTVHQEIEDFDLYFRPAMGIAFIESKTLLGKERDETVLAPSLSIGLLYKVSEQVSLGIENVNAFVWTEEDFVDDSSNDFLLSVRVSF